MPRAELWAILRTALCLAKGAVCKFYVDASYVLRGIAEKSDFYRSGPNGDLWTQLYEVLENLGQNCTLVKVKSHVTDQDMWTKYQMTPEMLIYNEGVDGVSSQAAASYSRGLDQRQSDVNHMQETYNIARRLAAICARNAECVTDSIDPVLTSSSQVERLRLSASSTRPSWPRARAHQIISSISKKDMKNVWTALVGVRSGTFSTGELTPHAKK